MIKKWIASLGALLLLYCSVDAAASERLGEEKYAITDVGGAEALRTNSDSGTVALGISNEEAVRREKVCDQLLKNCRERCINWKLKGDKLNDCRDMCNANWDDCIADIH